MLQIITGKFFRTGELYETTQRAVLYTNWRPHAPVDTCSGRLLPADVDRDLLTLVYEVEQRLEAVRPDGQPEVMVAVSQDFLANDFAAVTSFVLQVTCSPDADLVRRLTRTQTSPVGVPRRPAEYIPRVFDASVDSTPEDRELLAAFLEKLVALPRAKYVEAMRAIRRYVVGLRRIGDDLPLAYTLLVASIESLAQAFDEFDAEWSDLEQGKRALLEAALETASEETKRSVQGAILEIEHVALTRRFREFALARLPPAYFREDAQGVPSPARRRDLPEALTRAYRFRSELVHRLEELPRLLTISPFPQDVQLVERKPTLTFQGLARLARRVIMEVVHRGEAMEVEDFNYRRDLPNIVTAPVAPRYWVWRAEGLNNDSAPRYLRGFLDELASVLLEENNAHITDISDVLERIEQLVPGLAPPSRAPMILLYLLFHTHLPPEHHRPDWEEFINRYVEELNEPSVEGLLAHVLTGNKTGWSIDQLEATLESYFTRRHWSGALKVGPLFETAMILTVAAEGLTECDSEKIQRVIADAVEHMPGAASLLALEQRVRDGEHLTPEDLNWRDLLLPSIPDGTAPDDPDDEALP